MDLGTILQMGSTEFVVTNIKYDIKGEARNMEILVYESPGQTLPVSIGEKGVTVGRDSSNGFSVPEDF